MPDRGLLTLLLCCGLIAACASFGGESHDAAPPLASQQPPSPDAEILPWLVSFHALAAASPEEQRKEYLAAQAAFNKDAHDRHRIRLALAMLLPANAGREEGHSPSLAEATHSPGKTTESPVQQLLFLLNRQILERQRLRDDLHRAESKVQDEHLRNEELLTKLEALRRIDQDIKQRKRLPGNPP